MPGVPRPLLLTTLAACAAHAGASAAPTARLPAPPRCVNVRITDASSGYVRTEQATTDARGLVILVRIDERFGSHEHRNEARYHYDAAGRLVLTEEHLLHPIIEDGRPEARTDDELTDSVRDVYGPHGELIDQTLFMPHTNVLAGGHDKRDVRRYAWHGTFRAARGAGRTPVVTQLDQLARPLVELRVYGGSFQGDVVETSGEFTGATQTFDARGRVVRRTLGGGDPFVESRAYGAYDDPIRVTIADTDDDEVTTTTFDHGHPVAHEHVRHRRGQTTRDVSRDEYDREGRLARRVTDSTGPDGRTATTVTTYDYSCP